MSVLISEIAGPARWGQFNLLLTWVPRFFRVPSNQNSTVRLCSLGANGQVVQTYNAEAIYKPNSKNWAFEIPGANMLQFSGVNQRPLLVVAERVGTHYPFEVILPTHPNYNSLRNYLYSNRQTPAHLLCRAIVSRQNFLNQNFGINI